MYKILHITTSQYVFIPSSDPKKDFKKYLFETEHKARRILNRIVHQKYPFQHPQFSSYYNMMYELRSKLRWELHCTSSKNLGAIERAFDNICDAIATFKNEFTIIGP